MTDSHLNSFTLEPLEASILLRIRFESYFKPNGTDRSMSSRCNGMRASFLFLVTSFLWPLRNRCVAHFFVRLSMVPLLLAFSLAFSNSTSGVWLSPPDNNWPLLPIHAVLLPDGRVLTYGTDSNGTTTGYFIYDVWDPAEGLSGGHLTLENMTLTDLFCSSQIVLPQNGTVLISGGDNWTGSSVTNTGNRRTTIYSNESLSRANDMNRARWYATSTILPSGEVYLQGGSGGTDRPEVRTLDGAFRLLSGANTAALHYWYPRNFVMADGRIFGYDANGSMYIVDPSAVGTISQLGAFASKYASRTSSASMFRPGRILQVSGNSSAAMVVDLTSGSPAIAPTQSLSSRRQWVTTTLLADGKVLATGGSAVDNELVNVNNTAEIWNPDTGRWLRGAKGSRARLYHSIALLLPDASVLVGGGGAPGPLDNRHAEIYRPPYLFNGNQLASRPAVLHAPSQLATGQTFEVVANTDDIQRVTLVSTGSVTHSFNMGQRFVELQFSASGNTLSVQAPVRASDAPPGYYLLFLVNGAGVPSVAQIVNIGIATSDTVPPSVPSGLKVTDVGSDSVTLSWSASQDYGGSGLRAYRVYRQSEVTPITEASSVSFRNSGLPPLTAVGYQVSAVDVAGNESERTAAVSATTLADPEGSGIEVIVSAAGPGSVDLTRLGTSDWVHWGLSSATSVNRKANVPVQIGSLAAIGGPLKRFAPQPAVWPAQLWSDGSPVLATPGFAGGVSVAGTNKAYELSSLADPTRRTLHVFLGGLKSTSRIEARLSDTSVPIYRRTIGNLSGKYSHVFKFTYRAAAAGQRLYVRQIVTGGTGHIRLQAAALQAESAPVNQPPSITGPGAQENVLGVPVLLEIVASDPDPQVLTYDAQGLPPGLSINPTTGVITGTPTQAGLTTVTVRVSDGHTFATTNFTWAIQVVEALEITSISPHPPVGRGVAVTFAATVSGGINPLFKWTLGDGTESAWSASPSIEHAYPEAGLYWVTLAVKDDRNIERTRSFAQFVHNPLTAESPTASSSIITAAGKLWVVNPDNASVTAFSLDDHRLLGEVVVGKSPRTLAQSPDGRIWVVAREDAMIHVINANSLTTGTTIPLTVGSLPHGIVFAPDGSAAYVALEGTREILKLDPVSGAELARLELAGSPRHLSISADSQRLYVSRWITGQLPGEEDVAVEVPNGVGGEVIVVDAGSLAQISTVVLRHSAELDLENQGRGIPNYLGPPVISPDGASAWVPSKKDNVRRGMLRSGQHLNHQNTVRAISSRINLANDSESFASRIDHDDSGLAGASAFESTGVLMFVALETSREVAVVDVHNAVEILRISVGRAPQGLVVSPDSQRLYVQNFMDRTVSVLDLRPLMQDGQLLAPLLATLQSTTDEVLSPAVLLGKQYFYDAQDSRLSRDSYLSCASCHHDGGHDGRTWDMSGFGEGLRNTIDLRGRRGAQGRGHWSANSDEVQDLETQIRNLAGGTGLMSNTLLDTGSRRELLGDPKAGVSVDLDALAAYVTSLDRAGRSPFRLANGNLSPTAALGRTVFDAQNCAQCHSGNDFTNSEEAVFDVGTIRQPGSGNRSGAVLSGIDTPTLKGLWLTAPYLHDGSAADLQEAVRSHQGVIVSDEDLERLTAYLLEIDDLEGAP